MRCRRLRDGRPQVYNSSSGLFVASGNGAASAALIDDRKLGNTLADTRVLFQRRARTAALCLRDPEHRIVPYAMAGQASVNVHVEYKGVSSKPVTVPLLPSRPGIFSLAGVPIDP
jgi:uncharacterized protein (TIGR03437 family)